MFFWSLIAAALCAPSSGAQTLAPLLSPTPQAPTRGAVPLVQPLGLSSFASPASLSFSPAVSLRTPELQTAPTLAPSVIPSVSAAAYSGLSPETVIEPVPSAWSRTAGKIEAMSDQIQGMLKNAGDLSLASPEAASSLGASLDAVLRTESRSVKPPLTPAPAPVLSGGLLGALRSLRDIRGTLERLISDLSGRKATIEKASFSIFTGRGHISGLALRDPASPSAEPALRAFSIYFDVEVTSLLGHAVHFRSIDIGGLQLTVGESERIASATQAALASQEKSSGRSARIDHLFLRQARVHLNSSWLKGTPPTFYLRDMEWGPVDIGTDGKITLAGEHATN